MKTVNTPRQIVDTIKKQTQPKVWSKDLRNWYVAEIIDLVVYNRKMEIEEVGKEFWKWFYDAKYEVIEEAIERITGVTDPKIKK